MDSSLPQVGHQYHSTAETAGTTSHLIHGVTNLKRNAMDTLIEAIPTWALCYLFNSDATGLTDEEIALIDQWYTENKVMGITTATEQKGECFPYFSHYPAFGLPAEVVDCHVMVG